MTIDRLKTAYFARPFQQFLIHMADGRSIPVLSFEFMSFSPSGRTVAVNTPDEGFHILDLLLVTDLEYKTDPNFPSSNGETESAPVA